MLLVVDANIVLSSLIAGSKEHIIFSPKLELIAPDLLFTEIIRHKSEAISKSKFSKSEFETLIELLESRIKSIPLGEFISLLPKAEQILGEHKKDVPYVGLALKFNCPIWSYEKRFIKIGNVEFISTSDVRSRLSILSSTFFHFSFDICSALFKSKVLSL
ncbi:hypothetical protein HYT56_03910 [Candidatus Woesearchaeota archaeon]|nr:hypothetical protein [Candidatus Woesearchaeota archaeon]